MLESVEITTEHALKLLSTLFGPNTDVKLTLKKNQDLLKVISANMDQESISQYLELMKAYYTAPETEEHYGSAEMKDGKDGKEENRVEAIKLFALSQISNIPSMFRT